MQDRITRAYYWAGLMAALACFASLVVLFTIAAPGFSVAKDRARVDRLMDPAVAVAMEPGATGG